MSVIFLLTVTEYLMEATKGESVYLAFIVRRYSPSWQGSYDRNVSWLWQLVLHDISSQEVEGSGQTETGLWTISTMCMALCLPDKPHVQGVPQTLQIPSVAGDQVIKRMSLWGTFHTKTMTSKMLTDTGMGCMWWDWRQKMKTNAEDFHRPLKPFVNCLSVGQRLGWVL